MHLTSREPGTLTQPVDSEIISESNLSLIIRLTFVSRFSPSRPGKSPERGGRQMENYEPISPPQSYQGMDKQEASGPPPQRREADNSEIRYGISTVWMHDSFSSRLTSQWG